MLYKELYSDDFLNYFGENKEEFANMELSDDSYLIDLLKICSIVGVSDYSEYESRASLSRKIWEKLLEKDLLVKEIENMTRFFISRYSQELMMPKILVQKAFLETLNEEGYNIDQEFDDSDIERIIKISAGKLEVSPNIFPKCFEVKKYNRQQLT